jgi:acetylornithine/succinyldiaminopimelate/putrescine aminotransferase
MSNAIAIQKRFLWSVYPNRGLVFAKGEGAYLITPEGERYLDLMTNYGVSIFGYQHPSINRALIQQLEELPTLHGSFANDTRAAASRALAQRAARRPGQVYWSNSGTEAIEAALKLAVLATGKKKFLACENAYHGKTLGALSATHGQHYRERFEPLLWNFLHIPYDDPRALESAIDGETAAFVVEPIQGEGGICVPSGNYLAEVRRICSERRILLIVDEIQTGTGRTGTFLASEASGIEGDIVCLGKGLAGGMPVGATIATEEVAGAVYRSAHTSTFGGNPMACAGVLAVLQCLTEERMGHIAETGEYFRESLRQIGDDRIRGVSGKGLMIGISAGPLRDEILKGLQREKVLAIPAGADVVRFLPPYIVTHDQVEQAVEAMRVVLRRIPGN